MNTNARLALLGLSATLLLAACASQSFAGATVPEIGASTAAGAVTFLSGCVLVLRSRRK